MSFKAFIAGSSGLELSQEEFDFFRKEKPCGYILFQRNCGIPEQVKALVQSVKDAVQVEQFMVLVDQEGGRVARLKAPEWREFPAARNFGLLYEKDPAYGLEALRLASQWLARDLLDMGITVNCVPVLDVPAPGGHEIIGDRAYGTDPETVVALARMVIEGHLDSGVLPVIKHIPGHGRADADSHLSLPTVEASLDALEKIDFAPFKVLNNAPLGMTGHLLIPALDEKESVSTSRDIIDNIIRQYIGFDGALMSDDLSMGALEGSIEARAEAVLEAGCDIALHCNGDLDEMIAVAQVSPVLSGDAERRVNAALAQMQAPKHFDQSEAERVISEVLTLTV